VIKTTGNGELLFAPQTAALSGDVEVEMISGSEALTHWASPDDEAGWRFRVQQPGFFQAELTYATSTDNDAELELRIDGRIKVCSLRTSGGLDQFVSDTYTVAVPQSGEHSFAIRPRARASGKWLVLRSVRFIPVGANVIP
jgi:hypothetical protein